VQSELGKVTRSCSYDRAGLGESDPARGPRTPYAIAADLHALIGAAKLGKVVLVGHSLGGFNAKLTAALFPADVAGLVLLDPAEDRTWERSRAILGARFGTANAAQAELADQRFLGGLVDHYRRCAAKAAEGSIDLTSADWKRCGDPDRPPLGDALNAERKRVHAKPTYQAAQASEIAWSVYGDSGANAVYAALFRPGMLGDKPVTVLTHREEASNDPIDQLNTEQGLMLHRQSAALSRRGQHRVVANTGHYIQLDQPKLVIAAVKQVLALTGNK
jgi:pimeloyl-ACP methyl ester carboxylesterase